jgi:hypothetical protein
MEPGRRNVSYVDGGMCREMMCDSLGKATFVHIDWIGHARRCCAPVWSEVGFRDMVVFTCVEGGVLWSEIRARVAYEVTPHLERDESPAFTLRFP